MTPCAAGARQWRGLLVSVAVALVLLSVLDGADGAASAVQHSNEFTDEVMFEAENSWDRSWDQPAPSTSSSEDPARAFSRTFAREAEQARQYLAEHPSTRSEFTESEEATVNASVPDTSTNYIPSHDLDPLAQQKQVQPMQTQQQQQATRQIENWDAETIRSNAPDLTMPHKQTKVANTAASTAAAASDVQPIEVPKSAQGNRAAVKHMLKVTQQEMDKSFPGSTFGPPMGAPTTRTAGVAWQQNMPPMAHAASDPVPVSTPAPATPAREPVTSSPAPAPKKEAKRVSTKKEVKKADELSSCASVEDCQQSAQKHVHKAGEALAKAKEAAEEGDASKESYWKHSVDYEKGAAVAATVRARKLSLHSAKEEEEQRVEAALRVAQDHEGTEKAAARQTRKFAKAMSKESEKKAMLKLSTLRKAAKDEESTCREKKRLAVTAQAEAEKAAQTAKHQRSVAARQALESSRHAANKAFGVAHECREKVDQSRDAADTAAAGVEASKLSHRKDAACEYGRKMSLKLCGLSYKSASHVCEQPGREELNAELVRACMRKAQKDRDTCHGLAETRQAACERLARKQVYGATVSGYEITVGATMGVDQYSQKVDFSFRRGVARACGIPTSDVVTLNAHGKANLVVTIGVVGERVALKGKVQAVVESLTGGSSVGGVIASSANVKYVDDMKLPGQKPRKWVSEKAQKSWKLDQAETRKVMGMPSHYQAREVNAKAHTREVRSKQALAKTKTKEAQLKKTAIEMKTKVAARDSQRRQQERVEKAENVDSALPSTGAAAGALGSKKGKQHFGWASGSNAPSVNGKGDFTVIRLRWWEHLGTWLKGKYPALYDTLAKAKKAGDDAGDEVWMRFLLNWFYTKMRERSGYRFIWMADGSYQPARHLVLGCRRYTGKGKHWEHGPSTASGKCKGAQARNVWSVSIRSVNNLCYPGVSDAAAKKYLPGGGGKNDMIDSRAKACRSSDPVSVRLSRFRLVKPPRSSSTGLQTGTNGSPQMMLLRAYRAITPDEYQRTFSEFADEENDGLAGVHRVVWTVDEVVEYCDAPDKDGIAMPYDEHKSWPRKLHEAGKMKWLPITVTTKQKANSEMMLNVLMLQTEDKRLTITCRTPEVAGIVNGRFQTPLDTKCDIKISHWHYEQTCPPGKVRGLALQTSVQSRFDDATTPKTSSDGDTYDVDMNAGKTKLKFQKKASLRVLQPNDEWVNRGEVHMRLVVSEPHWTPSTQFQSHRHYQFSFGMDQPRMGQIDNSELVWDPQLSSTFRQEKPPMQLNLGETVRRPDPLTIKALLGLETRQEAALKVLGTTSAAGAARWCPTVLVLVVATALLVLGRH